MLVKELMKEIYIIDKDISLAEAAKIMSTHNLDCLVYYAKDEIKGIISHKDLIKNFDKKKKVSDVMSKDVITGDSENTIDEALEIMRENKIRKLPIIEEGKLTGVLSITDIAAHSDELEGDFFFE